MGAFFLDRRMPTALSCPPPLPTSAPGLLLRACVTTLTTPPPVPCQVCLHQCDYDGVFSSDDALMLFSLSCPILSCLATRLFACLPVDRRSKLVFTAALLPSALISPGISSCSVNERQGRRRIRTGTIGLRPGISWSSAHQPTSDDGLSEHHWPYPSIHPSTHPSICLFVGVDLSRPARTLLEKLVADGW